MMTYQFQTEAQLTRFLTAQPVEAWDARTRTAVVRVETADQCDRAERNYERACAMEVSHG